MKFKMNEELLNEKIVKASIKRYLDKGFSLDKILLKLMDIHLIIISEVELREFIKKEFNIYI